MKKRARIQIYTWKPGTNLRRIYLAIRKCHWHIVTIHDLPTYPTDDS